MNTPAPVIVNEPVESLIHGLRLISKTTGLQPEGEKLFRQLVNLDHDLLRQLKAIATPKPATSSREARLAEIERRLNEPFHTPAALIAFMRA